MTADIDNRLHDLEQARKMFGQQIVQARAEQVRIDHELGNLRTQRAIRLSQAQAEIHASGVRR